MPCAGRRATRRGSTAIAAAGAEGYVGDPDRIATLMEAIAGVTVVAWLLGSAEGDGAAELHAGRLRMLCEKLVDTPVRGLLYEGAGTLPDEVLAGGAEIVRAAAVTWNIPVEVLVDAARGLRRVDARRAGGGRAAARGMTHG